MVARELFNVRPLLVALLAIFAVVAGVHACTDGANNNLPVPNYWFPLDYEECSVDVCGSGVQYREVVCNSGIHGNPVEDVMCDDLISSPDTATSCTIPCNDFEWAYSSWDECNVTCGEAYQSRDIWCQTTGGVHAEPGYCQDSQPPVEEALCTPSHGTCQAAAQWNWGPWADCTASCGSGHETRDRWCVDVNGDVIDDRECDCDTVPTERACNLGPCEAWFWHTESWTDCSASCAIGYQERTVYCESSVRGRVLDSECISAGVGSRPEEVVTCDAATAVCPTYNWVPSQWAPCPHCGPDNTTVPRSITCESDEFGVVDSSFCECLDIPATEALCSAVVPAFGECQPYHWKVTSFSECPVTCGSPGLRTRTVTCVGDWYDDVDETGNQCYGDRPSVTEDCIVPHCPVCVYRCGAWSDCSVPCGAGTRTCTQECVCDSDVQDSDEQCIAQGAEAVEVTSKGCPGFTCPHWNETGFGDCEYPSNTDGVSCGTGWAYQRVWCETDDHVKVPDQECVLSSEHARPALQEACDSIPCPLPYWSPAEYGNCSVTCGTGVRTRETYCYVLGNQVDDSRCAGVTNKWATSEVCYAGPCPVYHWAYDTYSDCSLTCGAGSSTRNVWCVSSLTGPVADSLCLASSTAGDKPSTWKTCNTDLCLSPEWNTTGWSNCSATCVGASTSTGYGQNTRTMYCVDANTGDVLDDNHCSALSTPVTTRVCTIACEIYEWQTTSWTCGVTCGSGTSSRKVTCVGKYTGVVDTTGQLCHDAMPAVSADCSASPCPRPYCWHVTGWSSCPSCWTGSQPTRTRTVLCQSEDGQHTDSTGALCAWQTQPDSSELCPDAISPKCCAADEIRVGKYCAKDVYSFSCGDWGSCSASCGTGTAVRSCNCMVNSTLWLGDVLVSSTSQQTCHSKCVINGGLSEISLQEHCDSGVTCTDCHWQPSTWTDCAGCQEASSSVAGGTQTRTYQCLDADNNEQVASDACCIAAQGSAPFTTETCTPRDVCEHWHYETGNWTDCTATCNGGSSWRQVTCISNIAGSVDLSYCVDNVGEAPVASRVCGTVPCIVCTWNVTSDWTDCSSSCGIGAQTRDQVCACSDGVSVAYTDDTGVGCVAASAPDTERSCGTTHVIACQPYDWTNATSWTDCDVTCGTGVQTRTTECVGLWDGTVDETGDKCSFVDKPSTSEECVSAEYAICQRYHWTNETEDCSASCGFGTKSITWSCVGTVYGNTDKTAVNCDSTVTLASSEDCYAGAVCPYCKWHVAQWSDCGATCGTNTKTREVACVCTDGTVNPTGDECDGDAPATTGTCEMQCCTTYSWFVGVYGDCSVSCGTGTRSRDVFCHNAEGEIVDAEYCAAAGSQPDSSTPCSTVCDEEYSWYNADWSDCSSTCGAGVRTRTVECRSLAGSTVSSDKCTAAVEPVSSEECNLCGCETIGWEVQSWSDCSSSWGVGYQERSVACRSSLRGYVSLAECGNSIPVDNQDCFTNGWAYFPGAWGDCSSGTRSRNVYCVRADGVIDTSDAQIECASQESLATTEDCGSD